MTDCEKVLRILIDEIPHRNFDIINMFGAGFALAARVGDLRYQGWKIASGPPNVFEKERKQAGEWFYQLTLSDVVRKEIQKAEKMAEELKPPLCVFLHSYKRLTKRYIRTHHRALDRIFA